jgi:exonuclease SbcD
VLSGSLVRDPRWSYVALGHIHKAQDINEGSRPPVIYPGSIERVDFGEAADDKFFVVATVEADAETRVDWRKLDGRRFIDRYLRMEQAEGWMDAIRAVLPDQAELKDAVVRLVLEYPFDWEGMIDEPALRKYTEDCLEFHFIRKPRRETRLRLPEDQAISSLSSLELLNVYWNSIKTDALEAEELQKLAANVIFASENPDQQS